jgi:putative Holliday junction resolvase
MNMNGTVGEQGEKVQHFAEAIQKQWDGELLFFDERLTTMAARRVLVDADISRGKQKKVIDKLAAVLILQGYMDSHPNG